VFVEWGFERSLLALALCSFVWHIVRKRRPQNARIEKNSGGTLQKKIQGWYRMMM